MFKDWVMYKVKVYGYCHEKIHESHLNVTEIHCQLDPTERNGSLRHLTTRNVFWSFRKATLESGVFIKLAKLKILLLKSP